MMISNQLVKYKRNRLVFLLIIFLICPVVGAEKVSHSSYDICINKALDNMSLRACTVNEYKNIDKMLNNTYSVLLKSLPFKGQKMLKNAQRSWLKFRQYECEFAAYQEDGGTMWAILIDGCYLEMTKKRLSDLDRYLKFYTEYPEF